MEIINRPQRMMSAMKKLRQENKVLALIPTMGALHEGHMSLVKKARQMADIVVVSIFVNPTQFNEEADLEKYPRDLTADAALLADFQVDFIYAPDSSDIYGEGFSTFVTVDEVSDKLEGASRPGHFRGVATIVTILLNTIRPDFAYFGQKDAQQVAVIKRLTEDLAIDTEIVVMPIVREDNGLARSSRNERLTKKQRNAASIIYASLLKAQNAVENGELNASELTEMVRKNIESEPLAATDYIAVVDNETLEPIEKIGDSPVLVAVAVRFGEIRLIDNIILEKKASSGI
ncbi:MAG: pantoate--beta-alanine ligase [Pyrinomonadaceae bacterium]|nr:pantoate--beta-alanine ligase [Pyrinomonadaceae bacterium]